MATEIDKRVVEMQFDNKNFEKNCKESLTTLEKLKMALNFDGAKGLDNVTKAANKVDLSNISKSADAVSVKFSAMQIAGVTAIQEITKSLLYFGKNVWNSTFGQIKSGGMARTLKIEQANFQMQALAENMEQVKNGMVEATAVVKAMGKAASDAVDGTAYGLDAASAVASQLMASGLLDPTRMKDYLRAIAGAASMTGRSFEDIGNIFTTVASNGRLMTMQLRQFSAAGLNLSATLATHLGKTEAEINDMVTKGKITFEDFATALGDAFGEAAGKADDTFTGVTTNIKAQLSRIGQLFTDPFVENVIPFLKQVKARIKDVRTVLVPLAKTWSEFFKYISKNAEVFMKNLNVAKLRPFVNGIENMLVALIEIIWTIGRAIKEVFPKRVQDEISDGVRGFERLTRSLIPSKKALDNFKQIVKAVLIPFKALWTIGVAVAKYAIYPLVNLFITFVSTLMKVGEVIKPVVNSLLDFVTNGEFLSNVIEIIASSLVMLANVMTIILDCVVTLLSELSKSGTFQLILDFLTTVANLLMNVVTAALLFIFGIINDILSLFTSERITAFFNVLVDLLDLAVVGLLTLLQTIGSIFEEISKGEGFLADIVNFLKEIAFLVKDIFTGADISDNIERLGVLFDKLVEHVKNAWKAFTTFLHDIDAGRIIIYAFAIAVVLLILSIRRMFNAIAGIGEAIRTGIENVVGTLKDIRTVIKGLIKVSPAVQLILAIAVAIGVLTVSLKVLGEMDWKDLLQAGIALGVFAGGLLALGVVLSKIDLKGSKDGLALIPVILGMAVAVLAITAAVVLLSKADLTLKQLATALLTVVVLMAGVTGALVLINMTAKTLAPEQKKLIVTAGTIIGFALAITLLTKACIAVSAIPFKQAMTGLAAVGGLIVALAGSMALLNLTGMTFGGGVGAMVFVLSFLLVLKAIEKLSKVPFDQIVNGLKSAFGVIVALSSLYLAFVGISKLAGGNVFVENMAKMLSSLAAVIALSVAAVIILGGMDTETAARGIAMIFLLSLIFSLITRILLKSFDKFSTNMKVYKDMSILKSFSGFLIAFSACLIILSVAARIANGVSLSGWFVVSSLMGILAGCMYAIEKASAHTKRANIGVMISYIAGIVAILAVMAILTLTDPDALGLAIFGVVGVMLALALLGSRFATTSKEVAKADDKGKGVGFMVAFIAGLIGVIAAVAMLVKYSQGANSSQLSDAITAVVITMTLFIVMVGTLGVMAKKIDDPKKVYALALSIAILVGGIVVIAGALVGLMYASSTFGGVWSSLVAFGLVLVSFAAIIDLFEYFMMSAENVDNKRLLTMASTVVIMSSVLVIIVGAISVMMAVINGIGYGVEKSVVATLEIMAVLIAMMVLFNKFIKDNTFENNAPNGILKLASAIVIMSSVLAIIAVAIGGLTYISSISGGAFNTLVAFGSILLIFVALMESFGKFLKKMKKNNLDPKDIRSIATTIVIASASLAIIAASIAGLTAVIGISGDNGAIVALVSLLGIALAFAGICAALVILSKKIEDVSKLSSISKSILAVSASLAIIAASIAGMTYILNKSGVNSGKKAVASFVGIILSFAGICTALGVLSKKADAKKMAVAAVAIDIASASFVIIAGAITVLAKTEVDENFKSRILALLGAFAALAVFLGAIILFGENLDPASMLAASLSLVIGANSLVLIAEAIKKGVDAFAGVDPTQIDSLKKMMTNLLGLLVVLVVAGGVAGAFGAGGAMVIAGVLAMMSAFVIFAAGVDILAKAMDKMVDAILKLNSVKVDYTTIAKNLRNGIQGACNAIIDSAPDMTHAIETLFVVILAAVASVVGAVVAIGMAFILAFMEGMLAALPEALSILSRIMNIIVNWLKEPGQMETIGDFFRLVGEMLVEIVKGALEGLLGWLWDALVDLDDRIGELVFETTENFKYMDDAHHRQETNKMQEMQAQNVIDYYGNKAWSLQNENGLLVKKYDKEVVDSMINDFNRIAEAARNSGEELSDSVVEMVNSQLNGVPEDMLTRLDSAYGHASDTVVEFTEQVDVANEKLASGMHTEEIQSMVDDVEKKVSDATDKVNNKIQTESAESGITLDTLKEKASGLGEGFINSLKNIDIKKTANKLGIDSKKLGSMLGTITGVSFGEDYEETLDYYMEDAMKKIYDKSGQWQYKWQTFKNEQGDRIYKSAEDYANAQMDAAGDNTSYALKKLADFLGINLDVNDALKDGTDALGDFGSMMDSVAENSDKTKSKLEEFRNSVHDSLAQAMHGIFDEVKEQEYISPEDMLNRMSKNIQQVAQWAHNIATLAARGMSEGLLNELKEMGPSGAAKVQAFVDMTDEQLKAANRRWQAAEFLPDYGTKKIEEAYKNAGFNASLGFKNGVDTSMASDAMTEFADTGLNTLETIYEIKSPSKRTARDGEYASLGFAMGLNSNTAMLAIRGATLKVASTMLDTLKNGIKPQQLEKSAVDSMQGFSVGISKSIPQILSKINVFCNQIINTFMRVLRMHSPSKVMEELGEYAMDGFGIGFEDGADNVEKMSNEAANDILTQMKENIAAITNGWTEDNAYQPVIRPVFDMESLNQGFTDIQSWFANSPGLSLNGNLSRLTPTNGDDSASTQQIVNAINNINNDDVVREISSLRDDISQLQSAITSMQVVLNTGTLVGQLVEPIDKALGAKALVNSRGRY